MSIHRSPKHRLRRVSTRCSIHKRPDCFYNSSRLIYKKFIVFGVGGEKILKYAYNYITRDNTLIFRYDNALDPKARKLPTYPEHKHTQKKLLPIVRPAFENVLREISRLIENTGT